jgi:putative transposase
MAQRKQYTGQFKAKVVLQTLKGSKTINEIASLHGVHPVQVAQWKKQALAELPQAFSTRRAKAAQDEEELKARLYQQIGQLKMELDWLGEKSGRLG